MSNILRAILQAHGARRMKKLLWDSEFSRGRWDCLETTPGDCVYPYVEKYANGGSILDVGCGSGNSGNELDPSAYRHYTGVDISGVAIERARRRTSENGRGAKNCYVQSDMLSYVPSQRYDVVLFRDSIYYLPYGKIKAVLDRYSKYLREHGVFIVRMDESGGKYTAIEHTIESNFDVVERYSAELTKVAVFVFRSRV
jgi:SAM-dependent methyltransferase